MITIAVSSRALFNLEDGNDIYEKEGAAAFNAYMRKNEEKTLRPGVAFRLIKKMLALNSPGQLDKVEVILLSSNTFDAGARIMHSANKYNLNIHRAFFTSGSDRFGIAKAANVTLFLSTNPQEVKKALSLGIASATVMPHSATDYHEDNILRIAFDGDAVIFSDEAEIINQKEGLDAFHRSEQLKAQMPLPAGPFKPVLLALQQIQKNFSSLPLNERPLRVALVTARSVQAFERVLNTLRSWEIEVNEVFFCGGSPKAPFLSALQVDLFFDDGIHHVESAAKVISACHVPSGIVGAAVN